MEWNQKCGLNGKRNVCAEKKGNGKNGANATSNPYSIVSLFFLAFKSNILVKRQLCQVLYMVLC